MHLQIAHKTTVSTAANDETLKNWWLTQLNVWSSQNLCVNTFSTTHANIGNITDIIIITVNINDRPYLPRLKQLCTPVVSTTGDIIPVNDPAGHVHHTLFCLQWRLGSVPNIQYRLFAVNKQKWCSTAEIPTFCWDFPQISFQWQLIS